MKHKVLTVKQPWSFLICSGIKPIENRTWKTNYRGRVLIHAGKSRMGSLFDCLTTEQLELANDKLGYNYDFEKTFIKGAIIGSVRFVDCVVNHPSIWAEKSEPIEFDEFGFPIKYDKKIYNWVLANPILFEKPILNVKGKLGFWDYDLPEEYETILKL